MVSRVARRPVEYVRAGVDDGVHVDGVGGLVDGDAQREAARRHRRWYLATARGDGRVAGRAVDHRDGVVADVFHVDRVGGLVDGYAVRGVADSDDRRGLAAPGGHDGVAGGAVDHGHGVVIPVCHIDGVGRLVHGHSLGGAADGDRRGCPAAARRYGRVAGGTVDDRHRIVVNVRDVDGVGGLVDRQGNGSVAHRAGRWQLTAARGDVRVAGDPVNDGNGGAVEVVVGVGVRRVDRVCFLIDGYCLRGDPCREGWTGPATAVPAAGIAPRAVDDRQVVVDSGAQGHRLRGLVRA